MRMSHLKARAFAGVVISAVLCLTGCTSTRDAEPSGASQSHPGSSTLPTGPSSPVSVPTNSSTEDPGVDVAGTVVRFAARDVSVNVTIVDDNATTRDFLSMLPMTLSFEDYNGMEKITYPPRGFTTTGNTGMKPEVGDLFSFIPWSNLGFFYETGSLGFSDKLVRIGKTDDIEGIMKLDGQQVTISAVGK